MTDERLVESSRRQTAPSASAAASSSPRCSAASRSLVVGPRRVEPRLRPRSARSSRSFRSSRTAAGGSTPSSGSLPGFDPATWRLELGGPSSGRLRSTTASCSRCRRSSRSRRSTASPAGRCRTSRWGGVRIQDVLARVAAACRRARAAVRLGRASVRRLPDARAGMARRRDARLRDGREAAVARARRAAPARDPRDVRLQERQVAQPDRARRRAPAAATGSSSATTSDAWVGRSNGYGSVTPGYVAPASRAPSACSTGRTRSASSSLLALRARPLPAEPRGARRPPSAREGRAFLVGDRLGRACSLSIVLAGDRRGIVAHGARARPLRPRRRSLAARPPPGAAGPLQRRPEAERDADRGVHAALPRLGPVALARRARHALPLREHGRAPRRADVRCARAPRRPPLPRRDPPGHPPRAARDHARHGRARSGRAAITANGSHNKGVATVLVVDDEPIVRDVVVRYLQRDGFTTLEAGDGDTARQPDRERPTRSSSCST